MPKLLNKATPIWQIDQLVNIYTVNEEYSLKIFSVWTIKDNKAYVITYTAETSQYSDYLKLHKKWIRFEIKSQVNARRQN